MAYNPFASDEQPVSRSQQPEVEDDLELPPGEDLDFDKMTKTIQEIEVSSEPAVSQDDVPGPTPTTPRPSMPPAQDSKALFDTNTYRDQHPSQETSDDPDDDVMSMNTDINRHERTLSMISNQIRDINNKVDMIPDMDAKIRALAKSNTEMETRFSRVSHELDQLRKSFTMYQSSTANKIADVERRAAEKQLVHDPMPDTSIVPPSEINAVRDAVPNMNRQSETIGHIAVSTQPVKKKANIPDW